MVAQGRLQPQQAVASRGEASWKNLARAGNFSLQIPWEVMNRSSGLQGRVGDPGKHRRGCWETGLVIIVIIIMGAGPGHGCAKRFLCAPSPLRTLCQGQVALGNS